MQETPVRFLINIWVAKIPWRRERLPTLPYLPTNYSWASLVAQLVKDTFVKRCISFFDMCFPFNSDCKHNY